MFLGVMFLLLQSIKRCVCLFLQGLPTSKGRLHPSKEKEEPDGVAGCCGSIVERVEMIWLDDLITYNTRSWFQVFFVHPYLEKMVRVNSYFSRGYLVGFFESLRSIRMDGNINAWRVENHQPKKQYVTWLGWISSSCPHWDSLDIDLKIRWGEAIMNRRVQVCVLTFFQSYIRMPACDIWFHAARSTLIASECEFRW